MSFPGKHLLATIFSDMKNESNQDRRGFLKASGLLTGGALLSSLPGVAMPFGSPAAGYHFSANDTIKVALIGCGGRGTGAAQQALSTKQNVKIVALADAYRDRLDDAYKALTERGAKAADGTPKVDVPEDHKFVGFDAYKQAMALADVVILATPPASGQATSRKPFGRTSRCSWRSLLQPMHRVFGGYWRLRKKRNEKN